MVELLEIRKNSYITEERKLGNKEIITNIDVENQQAEFVFESERKILLLNLNKPEFLN